MASNPFVNPQDAIADAHPARGQGRQLLVPPAAQYVRVDDKLVIDYVSAGAFAGVTVNYRLLDPSGQIIEFSSVLALVGDSAVHTLTVNLNEGYLLGVTLNGGGAGQIFRGQAFFVVSIGRLIAPNTFLRGMTIISDYLCGMALLAWPGGQLRQPSDGPGWLRTVIINPPAAGVDFQVVINTNARVRLKSIYATLTTSAVVANRVPLLHIQNGGTIFFRSFNNISQAASGARSYSWGSCYQQPQSTAADQALPMPPEMSVPQLSIIQLVTTALQAADQWSNICAEYEQWFDV